MAYPANKINWSEEMITYLRDNFDKLTNKELAAGVGVAMGTARHKCYELGLRQRVLQPYTAVQMSWIRANYKTMGDVQMAKYFASTWPKAKGWTASQIEKKRVHMGLVRTADEKKNICQRNIDAAKLLRPAKRITDVAPIVVVKEVKIIAKPIYIAVPVKKRHEFKKNIETKALKPQTYSNQKLGKLKEKVFESKPQYTVDKIKVRLDAKTEVYAKPGYDIDELREKYLGIKPVKEAKHLLTTELT